MCARIELFGVDGNVTTLLITCLIERTHLNDDGRVRSRGERAAWGKEEGECHDYKMSYHEIEDRRYKRVAIRTSF